MKVEVLLFLDFQKMFKIYVKVKYGKQLIVLLWLYIILYACYKDSIYALQFFNSKHAIVTYENLLCTQNS